ncbi:acyl-CoA dehydrogenase family protein [Amycolatopsis magusensis]|uniref:Alkylation response protein AidB-like acyl-CoA dehydrogenase n=1 Tax=Amycolatopsis magusensis TaxID=882444 RepID=A0ABS4Q3E5_9PSEU|nr:acyl-CoA dehydrogenase family protein [Amycolatopsis magusensis]MBP2186199.1 alkylation response protein AidB-like acyl-CoA dehydrogenase [Amycolatopsis magusensis]MDI5978906.1 acyl-CoA dehydrogenase family protein [Amycolatopsis magusensis]
MHCLTERQQGFVDRAAVLADRFAERAQLHDRENTFPHENYEDLREAGFLQLSVPAELGGEGAELADILPVLERLAMGDGATALAFTMHLSPLGQWGSVWRRTGNPRLEALLRQASEGTLVWASITSEVGLRNDMTDALTKAVKVPGGFTLSGRKSFATNSAVATHCSTTARYEDAEGGPRVLLCQIALDQPGVRIHQTWDTLGMRGTQSNDVELSEVFVPDEAVVHSLPVNHLDARVLETVWAWAMPAFSATYTGIAAGALDFAVQRLTKRGRPIDPVVQDAIGECTILLESSRALMYRHAEEVASRRLFDLGVQEATARCALVKYVASNNAVKVLQRLVDVIGGMSYTRALPFERMWRDAQAGTFMPMGNLAARKLIGASALGVRTAPSIGFAETGHDSRAKEPAPAP